MCLSAWHHNRVIKLACTCASLTPAPRFQGSSSLCPSPFNCITRNTNRHLPYSTFFSLHLSLYLSQSTFSHTPSLCFTPFFSPFNIFFLHSLFISLSRATLVHSSFFSSFLRPLFFPFFFPSSTLLSFFLSSFLLSLFFLLFFLS